MTTSSSDSDKKVIPITPIENLDSVQNNSEQNDDDLVSLFEAQKKVYPRSVKGTFSTWRWILVYLTQIIFYGLPWLEWGNRQAVLFDLEARRFYIFGLVLYPQDLLFLTGLLTISAFALFLFTAVAGRLWCGYACPQTVYTEIFLWLEKLAEGDRSARMRRDAGPWNAEKVMRKTFKQFLWIGAALWTGYTFVGFFTPIKLLSAEVIQLTLGPWETFWILFYGFATYGNAGYLREQVCKYMCPYARFQSAMFDPDTLIVSYDTQRGEPRGARSKKADYKALNLGECVDCSLCVQVCPTGIDIRKGLQYECIGCGACADVCDEVMVKLDYPKGLVRYSTQNSMHLHLSRTETLKHIFRPRVIGYSSVLAAFTIALFVGLALRVPYKVDVVRDRGVLSRIVEGGKLENVYRLQLMNATEIKQAFRLSVQGINGLKIASDELMEVEPTESRWIAVRLQSPYEAAPPGSHPIMFDIEAVGTSHTIHEKSVFIVPK